MEISKTYKINFGYLSFKLTGLWKPEKIYSEPFMLQSGYNLMLNCKNCTLGIVAAGLLNKFITINSRECA